MYIVSFLNVLTTHSPCKRGIPSFRFHCEFCVLEPTVGGPWSVVALPRALSVRLRKWSSVGLSCMQVTAILCINAPHVPGGLHKILIHGNMGDDPRDLSQAKPARINASFANRFKDKHASDAASSLPALLHNIGV